MIETFIGYLASVLLGISLLVNNELRFRWINTFGCLSFIIYGILIHAFPIIVTNAGLFLINTFYLIKIHRTEEAFDLLEYKTGDKIVEKFLQFYAKDILHYFPDYKPNEQGNVIRFVVLRDMVIANIFEAALHTDGSAVVNINYTVAKYRDYKVGKFIFDKEKKYLLNNGIHAIVYENVPNKNHEDFLKKMGFARSLSGNKTLLIKELA